MKNKLILMSVMSLCINIMDASEEEESNRLIQVAQKYLQFVHDVGSAHSIQSNDPRMNELFAENLTKIDNRMTLFENNRQLLLPQMKGFKKEDDPEIITRAWTIYMDDALIIPSAETNCVIAHFEWEHLNIGRATTMAILKCNEQRQIEQITDVWAKVQKHEN